MRFGSFLEKAPKDTALVGFQVGELQGALYVPKIRDTRE